MRNLLSLVLVLSAVPTLAAEKPRTMSLAVDASDAPRRLLHARVTIPAAPGPLTVRYPKWIPGEHGPNGPIIDVAGIEMRAAGKPIAWTRDAVDLYAFRTTVPAGASAVEIAFDYLMPGAEREGYSAAGSSTQQLVALEWSLALMYPDGVSQRALTVSAKVTLPKGWKYGTALEPARAAGDVIEFKPVTLEQLVDSPVIAGRWFKSLPLGGTPKHTLDMAADSPQALEIEPATLESLKKLVVEAGALFGTRHYARYHFLLMLSDKIAHFGLEHHQSSDNRVRERTLTEAGARNLASQLLPHEFVHSWNGKFRRPAGLAVDGFDKPMKDELLWVYEGLTNYLAWVLAARAGTSSSEWLHEDLAFTAASMETRSGRAWRPLEDTTLQAAMATRAPGDWSSWRRGTDYYPEGTLLWLDADVIIRQRSNGQKSLDDFCKIFHGGANNGPEVKPYDLDDVIAALDKVVLYDWANFFTSRVYQVAPHAPLGGITNGGWKLVYSDKPNLRLQAIGKEDHHDTLSFSLGFSVREDGTVSDVLMGSPAFKAGLAPSMKLIGVDGRKYSKELLHEAIKVHAHDKTPIELLALNTDFYNVFKIDYHGGDKYPHLERNAALPDLLSAIGKPSQTSISPTR